ncbi:hypothetical protein BDV93DRAFT_575028 [Ceratobasidium sp. AG-I]|nr:hypothetical protein BDV93DRAFT_575028 [Ceratobasidium sp. AG-I]
MDQNNPAFALCELQDHIDSAMSNLSIEELVAQSPTDAERSGVLGATLRRLKISPDLTGTLNTGSYETATPSDEGPTPETLVELGNSLISRFQHLGILSDFDAAIHHYASAVALASTNSLNVHPSLSALAEALLCRFQRLGELRDIDHAVYLNRQLIYLTNSDDPRVTSSLDVLGTSLITRFERCGQILDVEQAVSCFKMSVALVPEGHPGRVKCWSQLGRAYTCRFERLDNLSDLNSAIDIYSRAIALSLEVGEPSPEQFGSLGQLHMFRFQRLGDLADLTQSVENHEVALAMVPDGHPDRAGSLSTLGDSLVVLFKRTGGIAKLNQAVEYYSQAVSSTPDSHFIHSSLQKKLGDVLSLRAERTEASSQRIADSQQTGEDSDLDMSIKHYRQAAQSPTGIPFTRFDAALRWARLSFSPQTSSPLEGYQQVMNLIPEMMWLGYSTSTWADSLVGVAPVMAEAAAAAIQAQSYDLALEWMEQARLTTWKPTMQLRPYLDSLRSVDSMLAEHIRMVAHDLNGFRIEEGENVPEHVERAALRIHRLASQWSHLISQARSLPGLERFMRVATTAELVHSAHSGAVVVINVDKIRCDALVILPHSESIVHVPLRVCLHDKAQQARSQLAALVHRESSGETYLAKEEGTFEIILAMLWTDIVKPVLDAVGYLKPSSSSQLPRITWCPAGPLASLPLHAAGLYGEPKSKICDYVVSSYTPDLTSLITGPRSSSTSTGIAGVRKATNRSGESILEGTNELDEIANQASVVRFTRLQEEQATTSNVLSAMKNHSWVHLACYVKCSHTDPATSSFHLSDGELNLATIVQTPLDQPDLAFLSVSQNETDGQVLSDGALKLAAGIILAGYPSVIMKMQVGEDKHTPQVVGQVYAQLLEGGGTSAKDAARALHTAVSKLRNEVGEKSFGVWVPYIHVGK